jgi:U3 small nucleolar RNA-associated protein 14
MQDELRAAANRPQESQRSAEHAQAAPEVEEENNAQDVGVSSKEALLAAFAGDDVAAEFEKDKAEVIQEAVAAVEEPTALPGWGVWAGSKREPRYDCCLLLCEHWL